MAVADSNKRITSTISKAELAILEKVAEEKGYKKVGKYLVAAGRLMKRMDVSLEVERELTKPLV